MANTFKGKATFSKATYKKARYVPKYGTVSDVDGLEKDIEQQIIEAAESSPEFRKEIRRTFDMANKRIKRLQQREDLLSPSLQALNHMKFGMTFEGETRSWDEVKKLYSEAVSFINSPTSTVSGAREFTADVKDAFVDKLPEMSEEAQNYIWESSMDSISGALGRMNQFTESLTYSKFLQDIYATAIEEVEDLMSMDAISLQAHLEQQILTSAQSLSRDIVNDMIKNVDEIMESFYNSLDTYN